MAISAIAGLAALGGAALGGLVTSFAVGLGYFALGAGLSIVSRALTPKPDFSGMLQGVTGTVREPASTRKVIYGKCRVGGSVVFLANSNENEYLYLVIAFAAHEIESYEEFYFNDELVWTASGGFQSDWGSWALINKYTGTQTLADATLSGASSFWSSSHVLNGISYAMVRLKWDKDRKKFPNGVPNISAVIKGKKVFDPRDSSTGYSNNPALCLRDYLTNTYYGLGEAASNLDDDSFETAANICDQSVSLDGGGSQSRWACDGVIDTGSSIKNNIEAILASMGGRLGYSGGKYFTQAAAYITPTIDIDESVMVGEIQVQTKQSRRGVYNGVKGVFLSEEENYTLCDYPPQISSSYATEDGDPIYLDMPLPFVTNNVRAQRLAKIALLKSRQQVSVTVPLNLAGLKLKAGDFITISNDRLGWSQKPFEVLDYSLSASTDGAIIVNVSCIETASSVYDWTTNDQNPFNLPSNPTTNDGSTVAAPTDLDLTETTSFAGDGSLVDALLIEWVASVDGFIEYYEITITEVSSGNTYVVTTTNTNYLVAPVVKGVNYAISVVAVNTIGARSTPLTGSLTPLGDQAGPSVPTSVSATGGFKNIVLSWSNPTDADLAYIDVYRAAESNLAYSRIATIAVSTTNRGGTNETIQGTYVDQGLANGEDYFYKLKAIDRSGNGSAFSAVTTAITDAREENFSPRDVRGYVYYQVASASNPGTPTASAYDFDADSDTDPFTWTSSNWGINPPELNATDGTFWASRFQVLEDSYGDATPTIEFSTPFESFVFNGLVTFVNLNNELGDPASTLITTIDGGLIKTGTVELTGDNVAGMAVRLGKTSYSDDSNAGFWLGNTGTSASVDPNFNIGSSDNYLKFDGTDVVATGIKIEANDGTLLLDAGDSRYRNTQNNNLVYNGDFSIDADPVNETVAGWDLSEAGSDVNVVTSTGAYGTYIRIKEQQSGFPVTESAAYASGADYKFAVTKGEVLYVYAECSGVEAYLQVLFYNADGSYTGLSTLLNDSDVKPDMTDSNMALRVGQITVPTTTGYNIAFAALRFGCQTNSNTSVVAQADFKSVGVSRIPPVIDPSYASTYIRDLSVDTLQLAGEAVTIPAGTDGTSTNTSLNTTFREVGSVRLSWGDGEQPSSIICIGGLQTGAASQDQGLTLEIRRVYGSGSYEGQSATDSKASGYGAFTNVGAFLDVASTTYNYVDVELFARTSAGTCSAGEFYIAVIGAKR